MGRNVIKTICWLFALQLLVACSGGTIFADFRLVPDARWHVDSVLEYTFELSEEDLGDYDVLTYVRNEKTYPYQNLWFLVDKVYPSGCVEVDTIECYLADNRGRWLGAGVMGTLEMPVLVESTSEFEEAGVYTYRLRHAMRDDELEGVSSMGLKVVRSVTE